MRYARTNTLLLRTPEGVAFSLPLAGPLSRLLAWLVDFACIVSAGEILQRVLSSLGVVGNGIAQAGQVVAFFVLSIGYGIALEWYWRGQTVGKRVMGLRVIDEQALKLEFSQVVVRNLLRFVDGLPGLYLVGGLSCLLSRRFQRLGDLAANTIVVRHPDIQQPDLEQLLGGKFNSLLALRHLAARLRQRTSPQIASVALVAILRRDEFQPVARLELFAELADHFRSIVEFPVEAVEQLSDEQYVRNVVEILFRSSEDGLPAAALTASRK